MVRYYFDILDGHRITADKIGMRFSSDEAAIADAKESLAIWASDLARTPGKKSVTVVVRNDAGEVSRLTLNLEVIINPTPPTRGE